MRWLSTKKIAICSAAFLLAAALLLNVTLASEDYRLVLAAASLSLTLSTVLLVRQWPHASALFRALILGGLILVVALAADVARRAPASIELLFPRERFLIPDQLVGWCRVTYGVPGAPSLQSEEGYRLVRVPLSGEVVTSDAAIYGSRRDEFYYERDNRRDRAQVFVRGNPSQPQRKAYAERYVFVGTLDELRRSYDIHKEARPLGLHPPASAQPQTSEPK